MPMPWRRADRSPVAISGATTTGPRGENQDRWAVGSGWAVVCDGVGGHAGGATAAQLALDVVGAELSAGWGATATTAAEVLHHAATAANAAVVEARRGGPAVADMATTLVAAVAVPTRRPRRARRWVVVQVGDSPAWLVGPDAARSITWDHNLVGDLVRSGALAAEDALGHRGRNVVTRAIGIAAVVEPELFTVDAAPGDAVVLASDGLSDVADPTVVVPTLTATTGSAAAQALVDLALARGSMDDVTVVVAR